MLGLDRVRDFMIDVAPIVLSYVGATALLAGVFYALGSWVVRARRARARRRALESRVARLLALMRDEGILPPGPDA